MRIVVISNRLPVVLDRCGDDWQARASTGGLVSALGRLLGERGGVWIGWPGITDQASTEFRDCLARYSRQVGYDVVPVLLSEEDRHGFYHGFSNEIIWPLFHDLQSRCNFVPDYWTSYRNVIDKFADVGLHSVQADDFIWVQDYHLMGLGSRLRALGLTNTISFFLHIPFPPPDIFGKLPWRVQVIESLLWYDAVGFQTPRDHRNFLACVREFLPESRVRRSGGRHIVEHRGRTTLAAAFPIGIDYDEFARVAAQPAVSERVRRLRSELPNRQIVLGVDRLDYTKGIPYRLKAFKLALQRYPGLHRRVTLLQVVVPSRQEVPEYQDLKGEIERLVTQINGEFTQTGWVPIHYVFREVDRPELVALYRAADIAFVTPLKDGMNLVAKEYCACQVEHDGVLILSEFAGAAVQLARGAILVNPYDLDRVAEALSEAATTTCRQRRPRMRRLRSIVRRQDVHWWASRFFGMRRPAIQEPPEERPNLQMAASAATM